MKILIEGENYPIEILNQVFDDPKFYTQNGSLGKITSVGYYHSYENKELVYMLPKVFMQDGEKTVFNISKEALFDFKNNESFKHKEEYNWIRQLLILFYMIKEIILGIFLEYGVSRDNWMIWHCRRERKG